MVVGNSPEEQWFRGNWSRELIGELLWFGFCFGMCVPNLKGYWQGFSVGIYASWIGLHLSQSGDMKVGESTLIFMDKSMTFQYFILNYL